MFGGLAKSLFGSSNDRYVKSLKPTVAKIAAFEPEMQAMTDEQLVADGQVPRAAGQWRDARQPVARSLRHGARSR